MPIAENAFTHGFVEASPKRLSLALHTQGDRLIFDLTNNGTPLSSADCREILQKMQHNTGHGLSMIHQKLKNIYQDDFSVEIFSDPDEGTCVRLNLPAKTY